MNTPLTRRESQDTRVGRSRVKSFRRQNSEARRCWRGLRPQTTRLTESRRRARAAEGTFEARTRRGRRACRGLACVASGTQLAHASGLRLNEGFADRAQILTVCSAEGATVSCLQPPVPLLCPLPTAYFLLPSGEKCSPQDTPKRDAASATFRGYHHGK